MWKNDKRKAKTQNPKSWDQILSEVGQCNYSELDLAVLVTHLIREIDPQCKTPGYLDVLKECRRRINESSKFQNSNPKN